MAYIRDKKNNLPHVYAEDGWGTFMGMLYLLIKIGTINKDGVSIIRTSVGFWVRYDSQR